MKDEKTGDDLVSIGFVVDLNYRGRDDLRPRPVAEVQDSTRSSEGILDGGERVAWGREGAPGRRLLVDAEALDAGRAAGRRRRRDGRHGRAEGRAPLHHVGHARGRGDLPLARRTANRSSATRTRSRNPRSDRSSTRCATRARRSRSGFLVGSLLAGPSIMSKGRLPPGRQAWHRDDAGADVRRRHAGQATPSRTASTSSTSSRPSTSPATRPATTRRTTSACTVRSRARSPRRWR